MNKDVKGLKQLINLPPDIRQCEWQTGNFGSNGPDWWLAAVLEVDSEKITEFLQGPQTREVLEIPPDLDLRSSFAALKSVSETKATQSNEISLITETYGVDPYIKSPLLTGKTIRLSENQVFIILWTH